MMLFDRVLTKLEDLEFRIESQTGYTASVDWDSVDHIVGGTPFLIQNGQKIDDYSLEQTIDSFLEQRHARTAIGLHCDGDLIVVVVDGKQPKTSVGMTMSALANLMQSLGCVEVLNLDGGGSSTMVLQNCVINTPAGDGDDPDNDCRSTRS